MFGVLNIHKPQGITSHDVISRLRRIYGLKRVGHMGTLDPLAEGVLPVCLGQATRLIEYFPDDKRYEAQITLGRTTTTLDSEGEVLSETDCDGLDLSEARLNKVLVRFTGVIQQQVPLYSAVHVDGKKLYELARQGKTVVLPTREAIIHNLQLLKVNTADPAHPVLTVDVHCGSGTYIRSLARDIGDALGCGAYMSHLIRTAHGRFGLPQSVRLETLQEAADPKTYLMDPMNYLDLPVLMLNSEHEARLLANGIVLQIETALGLDAIGLAVFQGRLLGVARNTEAGLKPLKIFPPETV